MHEVALEMDGISKSFHGVKALDRVSLKVHKGEVHALMGENGAGKSTLMKILTGLVKPDEGRIRFYGEEVRIDSPQTALQLGISMIHQELNPVPEMTVAENIFLGREPTRAKFLVDKKKMYRDTRELLASFDFHVEPERKVGDLSIAQKQMLEIIKAVSQQARLIIMDEPTSALSDGEVKTLFRSIDRLRKSGVPIIYISHRMDEIFSMTDRVTVLRDGQYIGSEPIDRLDSGRLISMMVGRPLKDIFPKEKVQFGNVVLEAKRLTRKPAFENVSFQVRQGEVLGIAGLMGAGRSEVMRALFGIDRLDEGEVWMEGRKLNIRHPSDAIRNGIAKINVDTELRDAVIARTTRDILQGATFRFVNELTSGGYSEMTEKIREKMRLFGSSGKAREWRTS